MGASVGTCLMVCFRDWLVTMLSFLCVFFVRYISSGIVRCTPSLVYEYSINFRIRVDLKQERAQGVDLA